MLGGSARQPLPRWVGGDSSCCCCLWALRCGASALPYLQFCNAVHQRCPLLIIICFAGLQGTPGGTARSSCGTTTPGTHLYCPPHCCAATLWGQAPPRGPQAALQACWTPPCRPSTDRRCRRSGGRGRSRSQSPPLKIIDRHACMHAPQARRTLRNPIPNHVWGAARLTVCPTDPRGGRPPPTHLQTQHQHCSCAPWCLGCARPLSFRACSFPTFPITVC